MCRIRGIVGLPEFPKKGRLGLTILDVDAWMNSSLYRLFQSLASFWSAYSTMLGRWHISGFRRLIVDLVSDGATFGIAISLGLLSYALPSVEEGEDFWNQGRQYSVIFVDKDDNIIGQRGIRQNDAIPLDEIPNNVVNATLATEDARFYEHFGVDFIGIFRAFIENMRANEVVQGGSSITQQVAKNLFLTPDRTIKRKLKEAFLAIWIEARLTKREILKLYLDRAYLGGGTYGVEAASQYYFGKSVKDTNLAEAAMLAGLFKAPGKYAPHIDMTAARNRASVVLDRMVQSGFISEGAAFAARRHPAVLIEDPTRNAASHFYDWAYEDVLNTLKSQRLEGEFVVKVLTTLDQKMQRTAEAAVNNTLDVYGKSYNIGQGALVSMRLDGAVQAMVGGRDYEKSQFNRATNAKRQPGSSFKPFVYLAAMRSGMTPKTVISDRPVSIRGWSPRNYGRRYRGPVTLMTALTKSINTIPVHISLRIGRGKIIETAKKIGLRSPLKSNPSMPLGTNEVTVLDITSAYAGFANGGKRIKPYAVVEIRRPNGDLLYSRKRNGPPPEQLIEAKYVYELNTMLNNVILNGTGRRANLGGIPAAGKTGTTQGYRDAWFIGFTGLYVTGVWLGNYNYQPMRRVTGGFLPAQTWKEFMSRAHIGKEVAAIPGLGGGGGGAGPVVIAGPSAPYEYAERVARATIEERDPVVDVLRAISQLFLEAESLLDKQASNHTGSGAARTAGNAPANSRYSNRRPRGRFSNSRAFQN